MSIVNPKIEKSWKIILKDEFQKLYFKQLKCFLIKERKRYTIYPKGSEIFHAFQLTPFEKVRVVIIGQDPYHGHNQANGLSFSVKSGVSRPPSLKNILKELVDDLGIEISKSGDLSKWAKQGVLLLNATLSVREQHPGSHQKKGWEEFTDRIIKEISKKKQGVVFLLWGRFAQKKEAIINLKKHHVLKASHPSPFSAYNGFFGCKHFSKTNGILIESNTIPINWKI